MAVSEWPLRVGLGSHWCVSEAVLKLPPRWLWPLTAILMAWSCSSWWALTTGLINTGFHPQSEREARKPITGLGTAAENPGSESLRSSHAGWCLWGLGFLCCKDTRFSLQLKMCNGCQNEPFPVDLKQIPSRYQHSQHSGLVWDGILRYHFIFSPHFYSLPHYLTALARCSLVPVLASSFRPTPPPHLQQPQIRSQPPLKKTMISTLENVQSKLLIAAIPGPPVCLVPALASFLS